MTQRTQSELLLVVLTLIWGSTFALNKMALHDTSPFTLLAARFSVGALMFALLFFRRLRNVAPSTLHKGVWLGLMFGTALALQTLGLRYTTASKSGFITGLCVVFTPLIQLVIEHRPPRRGNVVGIVIVAVGLYLLTSPSGAGFNVGDALTLLASFLFGVYIVYVDLFTRNENVLQLTFLQILCTAFIGFVLLPFETPQLVVTGKLIAVVLYLGAVATGLATYLQTRFQRDTTPTRAVVIYALEPVFAAAFAFVLLGELLGKWGMAGAALIVTGVLVSELSDARELRGTIRN
ncbi:MAG: DMT family transporter [Abditibacteriales bacterium]|nr:DMT family transporter [Abditibacteriales bacterium]MDW8365963.1 DMT family transporter [Abditibacteriales bacterium]